MSDPSIIPAATRRYIRSYVARRRRVALLRRAGAAVAMGMLWMLGWAIVDRLVPLPGGVRWVLGIINATAMAALLFEPMRAMALRRFDYHVAAAQIEMRDRRFGGALETAVTQLLLAPSLRGSTPLLHSVVRQADALAIEQRAAALVPMRLAARPWIVAAGLALVSVALWRTAWVDLPTLLQRQFKPLANIAAVTTTRLSVEPGDVDIEEGASCTISVRADRIGSAPPVIQLTSASGETSAYSMMSAGDSKYSFTLNAIDRDWHYNIIGGDARSATYSIRVLRHPGLVQFRIRLTYPAYINRPPASVVNTDGLLEAPEGTQALVDLVCTEPVASAVIVVGDLQYPAKPTREANVYQATVPIARSSPYQVRLISVRGAAGVSPDHAMIRAQPDEPPRAVWTDGIAECRLEPSEAVSLRYRISDDFGIASAKVAIQKNNDAPRAFPLVTQAAPRAQDGEFMLRLSDWELAIGDVLSIRIDAIDAKKQTGGTDPMRILIAPQSVSIDQRRCDLELEQAMRMTSGLADEMAEAVRNDQQAAAGSMVIGRNAHLARSAELSQQIEAMLLRSIKHNRREALIPALLEVLDHAAICQSNSHIALAADVQANPSSRRQAIDRANQSARWLRNQLRSIAPAEQARFIRIDLLNLQTIINQTQPAGPACASLLADALRQAGHSLDDGIQQVGIAPDDDRLMLLLEEKTQAADAMIASAQPIDWSNEARGAGADELSQRLLMASRAIGLQVNPDLPRARDLNLAAYALQNWPTAAGSIADMMADLQKPESAESTRTQLRRKMADNDELAAFEAAATEVDTDINFPATAPADPPVLQEKPVMAIEAARWRAQQRIQAVPAIAAALNDNAGQIPSLAPAPSVAVPGAVDSSTPTAGEVGGYDESLRVYFQLLRNVK